MKNYLKFPVISLEKKTYLSLIVLLAPLLNFLAGINVDIYSPSLPAISRDLHATVTATKNTITVLLVGWMLGSLLFGVLIDSIGRKIILVTGLFIYVLASFSALWAHTIHQLMLIRFIQGLSIATITIGCRTLIIDTCQGPHYDMAILYTAIGYGLGPIIGPFIGGILQHVFGWQANFMALFIIGSVLLLLLVLFVKESIPKRHPLHFRVVAQNFFSVIKHRQFMVGVVVLGLFTLQVLLYPTLGPFIVENILHHSVLAYGNTALVVGGCYLVGTLGVKVLIRYLSPKKICYVGYMSLLTGLAFAYLFTVFWTINLISIMIPVMFIAMSSGFIFPNIFGANLKQFPNNAGIAMAVQIFIIWLVSSVGIFITSHIHIDKLVHLSDIYSVIVVFEVLLFFYGYRSLFDK